MNKSTTPPPAPRRPRTALQHRLAIIRISVQVELHRQHNDRAEGRL